jgi:hypothetical protein
MVLLCVLQARQQQVSRWQVWNFSRCLLQLWSFGSNRVYGVGLHGSQLRGSEVEEWN